jgi:excisionase family DNA binding protein
VNEPLKNYQEVADLLGVPLKWLQDKVQAGDVPHTRLGKHVRFTKANIDEIIARAQRPAKNPAPIPGKWAEGIRPASRPKRRRAE